MARVLYLLDRYPQISETYIEVEIERVARRHEVAIAAIGSPDMEREHHRPFIRLGNTRPETLTELVRRVRPDIVHGHYLTIAPALHFLARVAGVFFTLRTHSFDVLQSDYIANSATVRYLNDSLCRGVLCFPFAVDRLRGAGIDARKVHPCWPVVDIGRFRNREPNGDAVMNSGAALPKKAMTDFVDLAAKLPQVRFDLYSLGYNTATIAEHARLGGKPVNILSVQPEAMPAEYKKHRWLVYTASKAINTVGWPMSVAEAQASGVGVLMQNIRPDLQEYVGPGYLFDTIEDACHILSLPFPSELREAGFAHAEKSNIDRHIGLLHQLWE